MQYPLFNDPESYLKTRRGVFWASHLRKLMEENALDRIMAGLHDVRLVCDAPCGPGTLFPYWNRKGFKIIGVDLSIPMVNRASEYFKRQASGGYVLHGDIVSLPELLRETPDLMVSVRFIYYFNKDQRVNLLRQFVRVSNRYVLVQYKTGETLRARMNSIWRNGVLERPISKQFLSFRQIESELSEAGLTSVRLVPISQFSDRVFVIAERR